jgi:hypothetical protein
VSPLVNFICFQLGWFGCVLGAAAGHEVAAVGSALLMTAIAWWYAPDRRRELALYAFAAIIGTLCDSVMRATSLLHYRSAYLPWPLPPAWDIALWPLFASTLNGSLAWLKPRLVLAALFGAVGGPLAFLGGARLGAVQLRPGFATLLLLGAAWSVVTPVLLVFARRLDAQQRS